MSEFIWATTITIYWSYGIHVCTMREFIWAYLDKDCLASLPVNYEELLDILIYTNDPNGANDEDVLVDMNEDDTEEEDDNKSDESDDEDSLTF